MDESERAANWQNGQVGCRAFHTKDVLLVHHIGRALRNALSALAWAIQKPNVSQQ